MKLAEGGPGGVRSIQYDADAGSRRSRNGSLPKMRIATPIGVITRKNNSPSTIGLTTLCNRSPTFIHKRLSGARMPGDTKAAIAKAAAIASDQLRGAPPWISGSRPTIANTPAKTRPKLRFDEQI